jgi:hypothetical protein
MAEQHTSKPDCPNGTTIREYFTLWLTKLENALDERNETQQRAVATALAAQDKRLDSMNEFRQALNDRDRVAVTKAELEAALNPLKADVRELRDWKNEMGGKANQSDLSRTTIFAIIALLFGAAGTFIGIISMFTR